MNTAPLAPGSTAALLDEWAANDQARVFAGDAGELLDAIRSIQAIRPGFMAVLTPSVENPNKAVQELAREAFLAGWQAAREAERDA